MATALVNSPFTFQVLFLGTDDLPTAVLNPTISVFMFSDAGVKQVLVDAAPMLEATPVEVGRYTYTYTIPSVLNIGSMVYAEMVGELPVSGDILRSEESVSVVTIPPGTYGLSSTFVKGG